MKNTKNYNLQKPDFNNVADIQILNDNFDKIDTGITPFYVATLNSTNIYEVATGLSITKLNDGFSVRIAIPSDSTGAVSIIIDGLTAVLVKKANGRAVSNLKANGVYSLTYYNSSFFLDSGGDESDTTTVGTDGSKVLEGETFIGSDGEIHTGTIPTRTAVNTTLKAGQSVILDSGYYKDKSTIKAETLATAMSNAGSTLTSASQLVSGVKAVNKNGSLITGTATIESLGGIKGKKLKYNKGETIPIQSDAKYMLFTADGYNYENYHILLEVSRLQKNKKYYGVPNHCFISSGIYGGTFQVITNDDCSSFAFRDDYNELNYIYVTILY